MGGGNHRPVRAPRNRHFLDITEDHPTRRRWVLAENGMRLTETCDPPVAGPGGDDVGDSRRPGWRVTQHSVKRDLTLRRF